MSRGHVMNVMCEYFLFANNNCCHHCHYIFLNRYIVLTSFFSISYKISPSSNMQQFYSLLFICLDYLNNVLSFTYLPFLWQTLIKACFQHIHFSLIRNNEKLKGRNVFYFMKILCSRKQCTIFSCFLDLQHL